MAKKYLDNSGLSYFWGKLKAKFNTKQDTLVSGTNIKTINDTSILGSGDISTADVYSTSEIKTNKRWIDGKPIYRKVYNATINDHNNIVINNFVSNVDTIINFYGGAKANKFGYPIYYKDDTDCFLCILTEYNTRLEIQTGNSYPSTPFVAAVVIEYTKTN